MKRLSFTSTNRCVTAICLYLTDVYKRQGVTFTSPQAEAFGREYGLSVPIPKMMATSNYWVQMEIAFTRIWSGDGVSDTLKALSEKIMTQVTGQPFEEEYIEEPEKEEYAGEEE